MNDATTLYAKRHYTVYAPGDVDRPMTIAAFYVAQGTAPEDYDPCILPSLTPMRRDVLTFLASSSAINHWLNTENRLARCPSDNEWVQLTRQGLAEIKASYEQSRNAASERAVRSWIKQMITGGGQTEETRSFLGALQMKAGQSGAPRTRDEALQVMGRYFRENRNDLPAGLDRESILERLMSGGSPEEAFTS